MCACCCCKPLMPPRARSSFPLCIPCVLPHSLRSRTQVMNTVENLLNSAAKAGGSMTLRSKRAHPEPTSGEPLPCIMLSLLASLPGLRLTASSVLLCRSPGGWHLGNWGG